MLEIPKHIHDDMLSHAREGAPVEVCGILAGKGSRVERIYRGTNADPSAVSYEFDPREQLRIQKEIRNLGLEMLAIYHSHPGGVAYPSPKDIRLALWDAVYIIIGLAGEGPEVRGYRIDEGKVEEAALKVSG
jgi:proteasome lid subunit RPN8/RPN11